MLSCRHLPTVMLHPVKPVPCNPPVSGSRVAHHGDPTGMVTLGWLTISVPYAGIHKYVSAAVIWRDKTETYQFLQVGASAPLNPSNLLLRCLASGSFNAARLFGSSPRRSPSVAIIAACWFAILIHGLACAPPRLLLVVHSKSGAPISCVARL